MLHVDDGQLNALLDGELSREEAREVEAHVASCPQCQRRLDEARAFLAEAGELLAVLTPKGVSAPQLPAPVVEAPLVAPVAQGPAPANPPVAGERSSAPKVAKTAKEIAVSVDGRTEKTPAIPPVFAHEVPAVPKRRREWPDLEKLAWAASLILAVGVGYLANEVYHIRRTSAAASPLAAADQVSPPAASPAAETDAASRAQRPAAAPSRTGSSAGVRAVPAERPNAGAGAASHREVASTTGALADANADGPKPRVSKPPPEAARRQQPQQLAQNEPRPAEAEEGLGARAPMGAALPAAPAPAPSAENRLSQPATAPARASALPPGTGEAARDMDQLRRADEAPASASFADRSRAATSFQRVPMEEAVRRLSGSIRLIDGMNPARVDVGPGTLVPGADPERDVVRVIYGSGANKLLLDQQLGAQQAASFNGLMPGDTLVSVGDSTTQVRWVDRKFWMSLTGRAGADSLRALLERVR